MTIEWPNVQDIIRYSPYTFKINKLPGGKNVWHILWRNKNVETVVTNRINN